MSYSEMGDRFQAVSEHLRKGDAVTQTLWEFFNGLMQLVTNFSQGYAALLEALQAGLVKTDSMDTLSAGLLTFATHLGKVSPIYAAFAQGIHKDLLEPLGLFAEHFQKSSQPTIAKASAVHSALAKVRDEVAKARAQYYHAAAQAEKEPKSTRSAEAKLAKAKEEYVQRVERLRAKLSSAGATMPKWLSFLQQTEESRIGFVKLSLEKYIAQFERFASSLASSTGDVLASLNNITPSIDIRVFVDANQSPASSDEFVSYEDWKQEGYCRRSFFHKTLGKLLSSDCEQSGETDVSVDSSNSPVDCWRVCSLLKTAGERVIFIDVLDAKKQYALVSNESMGKLVSILNHLLSKVSLSDDTDYYVVSQVLLLSQVFFTIDKEAKKTLLSEFINDHLLWQQPQLWTELIERSVEFKLEADKECLQRTQPPRRKNFLTLIQIFATHLPDAFHRHHARAVRACTYLVAGQFIYYMFKMNVGSAVACEALLTVSKKAKLDADRTCTLLAEVHAGSNLPIKARPKRTKCSASQPLVQLALAMPFLDQNSQCVLLQVSKHWNTCLSPVFYKLRLSQGVPINARVTAWRWVLTQGPAKSYDECLAEVAADQAVVEAVVDVIELDAVRSFRNHTLVTPEALKKILVSIACCYPSIGYCQGMNYIAGTLLIQTQDEALAYQCMKGMIEKFQLQDLFVKNLPKLKLCFYQLDRLMNSMLPSVHESFKNVGMSSSHFASPWFITLFSSVMQHKVDTLMQIWDLLLLHGWKVMFKASLAILDILSEQLTAGSFDDNMFALAAITQAPVQQQVLGEEFIQKTLAFPVTTELLDALAEEYEALRLKTIQHV